MDQISLSAMLILSVAAIICPADPTNPLLTIVLLVVVLLIGLYYAGQGSSGNESFDNTKDMVLYIFLTRTCPYCVNYDNNMKATMMKELGGKMTIKHVYNDDDPDNLFEKHNVQYVPAAYVEAVGQFRPLKGPINPDNVNKLVTDMQTA